MFPRRLHALAAALLVLFGAGGCEQPATPEDSSTPIAAAPPNSEGAGVSKRAVPAAALRREGPAPPLEPLPAQLGQVLRLDATGRTDAARELAQSYTREHPLDGRGHVMIGMTYHGAGNYEPAVSAFQRALELSPDYYPALLYLGECLYMLGDMAGAGSAYEALSIADPREPKAHFGLGIVALEESRLAEAEPHLRRAIELFDALRLRDPRRYGARRPELAQCHARLADVHFARDEYASARDELLKATSIEPRNISAFYVLSMVHRRLGDEQAAEQALQRYETAKAAILRATNQRNGNDE